MNKPTEKVDELSQRRFLFGSSLAIVAIAAVTIAALTFTQTTPGGTAPDAVADVQPILAGYRLVPDEISSQIEVSDILNQQLSVHG